MIYNKNRRIKQISACYINADKTIVEVFAVRVSPVDRVIKDNELCTYKLYKGDGAFERELLTEFQFPYGDGVQLGIEILEVYQSVLEMEEDERRWVKTNEV